MPRLRRSMKKAIPQASRHQPTSGDEPARVAAMSTGARYLLIPALVAYSVASAAATTTVTTEYQYNADGALTAITKQAADGSTTTTYLVWDDFTPNTSDPTTGTVSAANGRLVGFGSSPDDLTTTFQFDVRDRLKSFSGGAQSETYDYHANGTMASSSTAGDALQFYYDKSKNAQCTNIYQTGQSLWSGYLGHVRYLNDGSEQALMKPRKDMAMSYDASQQTVAPYTYDAYGSQPNATPQTGYDLHQNPFQYAGEYRDPLWGGYYLRARWYDPDLQTFLSRDSQSHLNRYGYAGGNPVMRIDPSGRGFSWSRDIGKPLTGFLTDINKGVGGHFARFFLTPILGPLQILANPKAYWQAIIHDKNGAAIFLVAPIVSGEAFGIIEAGLEPIFVNELFVGRTATALATGVAQSTTNAAARGFNHFNWSTFLNGEEGGVGSLIEQNPIGGRGYNRFNRSGQQIADLVGQLDEAEPDTVLIVRQRTNLRVGPDGKALPLPMQTGPIQERLGLGLYHEKILAIGRNDIFTTEVEGGLAYASREEAPGAIAVQEHFRQFLGKDFEVIGIKENFDRARGFDDFGTQRIWTVRDWDYFTGRGEGKLNPYRTFTNNCHYHAAAVLKDLGF
jgi:RHS repeat-associated protein